MMYSAALVTICEYNVFLYCSSLLFSLGGSLNTSKVVYWWCIFSSSLRVSMAAGGAAGGAGGARGVSMARGLDPVRAQQKQGSL